MLGVAVGVLGSVNVFYEFTRTLSPLISWSIMGGIYIFTGILCFVFIREPVDIEKKEG